MLLDVLTHLVSLDIVWIIDLILGNILWLFLFYTAVHIATDGKKVVLGTIILFILAWALMDFELAASAILFAGGFLGIYYITKIAFLGFFEKMPGIGKNVILMSEIHFLATFILFNIVVAA